MRKIALFILAFTVFMVSLSGCQPGLPFEPSAPNGPQPLTGENASRLGAAALIIEQLEGIDHFAIVPVSAETGERIAGAQPIELGGAIAYGFSRDRSQMAFLSNRSEGCQRSCLRVMDLRSWEEVGQPIPVEKSDPTWFLLPDSFDSDNTAIPVVLNKQTDTLSEVILVDRAAGAVSARVNLPANILKLAVTEQDNLAVYGLQTKRDGSGPGAYLALLSGTDLTPLWEQVPLEIQFYEGGQAHPDPNDWRYYDPAAVFAPGGQLFVSAANRPALLTVDFEQRSISTHRVQPRTSWIERLLGVTTVHAKTMNGVIMTGALSPDGRFFIVVGQETREIKHDQGGDEIERTPLGLQVIDTQDGTLLRTFHTDAHQVHLAPDGKHVMLNGWSEGPDGGQEWAALLDASSWKVIQAWNGTARPSRLLDGSTAWLVVPPSHGIPTKLELYRPGDREPRSRVTHKWHIDWIAIP